METLALSFGVIMKKSQQKHVLSDVASQSFVPRLLSGIAKPTHDIQMFKVSAETIDRVFDDQPVPFALDRDGSADPAVYEAWLKKIGADALQAFDDFSDIIIPDTVAALS